jgi:hypothetical protein
MIKVGRTDTRAAQHAPAHPPDPGARPRRLHPRPGRRRKPAHRAGAVDQNPGAPGFLALRPPNVYPRTRTISRISRAAPNASHPERGHGADWPLPRHVDRPGWPPGERGRIMQRAVLGRRLTIRHTPIRCAHEATGARTPSGSSRRLAA